MKSQSLCTLACAIGCFFLSGCNFEVPLTAKPTHPINDQLLGDWVAADQSADKLIRMNVRRLDDACYVISYDGDLYRAYHSDFAGRPFDSVQDLNSNERKYAYFVWQLSADGAHLSLAGVRSRLVPEGEKDLSVIQGIIRQNLAKPELLGEELVFTRKKPGNN